jgi:hypothetical protein
MKTWVTMVWNDRFLGYAETDAGYIMQSRSESEQRKRFYEIYASHYPGFNHHTLSIEVGKVLTLELLK